MMLPLRTVVIVTDGGPWAEHDQPCAVCWRNKAILDLNTSVFHPCDTCSALGWKLECRKRRRWWKR